MFTPMELAGRRFPLSPDTLAVISRAETSLVRLEDKAEGCEVRLALARVLTRLEAISSIRIEGRATDLTGIMRAETLLFRPTDSSADRFAILDSFDFADDEEWRTTLEVIYYQMALGLIYQAMGPDHIVTPQSLLDIHSLSRFGVPARESGTHLRAHDFAFDGGPDGAVALVPPCPEMLSEVLGNICRDVNAEAYTPVSQAGIIHFQFECAKPFKTGLDKTGRLLAHLIIHRRGLARRIVAPIAFVPAVDTRRHAAYLLPYRLRPGFTAADADEAVDEWVAYCGYSTEESVRAADVYLDAILALRSSWIARFGKVNRGSAVEGLLGLLPGHPMLTVRQASSLLGKSISSVNEALLRLESAGIVNSGDGFDRNRIYTAPEAVRMLMALEKGMFPATPVARDSIEG